MGKVEVLTVLENHGLLRMPVKVFRHPTSVTSRQLQQLFGGDTHLVVRTGADSEERNLPRLVGATAETAVEWINVLPSTLSALVQPYEQVLFSVELAAYEDLHVAEVVPGIWELDNRLAPLVLQIRGDRVDLTATDGGPQRARFYDPHHGLHERPTRVDDWQLATVLEWLRRHHRALAAVRSDLGHPFGLKLHYSARFGLSPQNLRGTVPDSDTWHGGDHPSTVETTVVSSTNEPIPTGPTLLNVSIAREDHTTLTTFIHRLREAGTREVFLRSGVLSHLAINLREAGITVRNAHG
ncbi:hypothetical protein KIK06_05285 [Nocardiopsis sp. EMB25]|uniref:hypothetical protein n=1 Tax=Nocardiopsis sp. EMB25 TaxID=2835867 RepID=UPI0022848CED|nr:hypothetical protein [Nocardiopsis sp. EMB25]MCY9783306.1 hypothetical protein [Nocardiopsis sp. EMB25]